MNIARQRPTNACRGRAEQRLLALLAAHRRASDAARWASKMVLRVLRSALPVLALALAGCSESPVEPSILEGMDKRPALKWLEGNSNKYALASNRFGPTANARIC